MYESGQSEGPAELRSTLLRLEEAVARHEALLAGAPHGESDASLQVVRHTLALMQQEAQRLRQLLAAP